MSSFQHLMRFVDLSRDLLFDTVYEKACVNPVSRYVFLECLEPFILNDRLRSISPMIVQQFVEHYQNRRLFLPLEACIIHLDITSLDIHQVHQHFGWVDFSLSLSLSRSLVQPRF